MALLCIAQLLVLLLPFRIWRGSLGGLAVANSASRHDMLADSARPARRLAVHVERGAARLPFSTKCLPRAMALCWLLRLAGLAYVFKIAARPEAARQVGGLAAADNLHAWVESGGATVIGAIPGPWLVVLALQG